MLHGLSPDLLFCAKSAPGQSCWSAENRDGKANLEHTNVSASSPKIRWAQSCGVFSTKFQVKRHIYCKVVYQVSIWFVKASTYNASHLVPYTKDVPL